MKQKIYLSGKITGLPILEAIKNFESAENQLKELAIIVNPMRISHYHDRSWQSYMKEDIKALMNCDAIAMLPNFNESKGALIELNLAKSLGFEIIYLKEL